MFIENMKWSNIVRIIFHGSELHILETEIKFKKTFTDFVDHHPEILPVNCKRDVGTYIIYYTVKCLWESNCFMVCNVRI